MKLTVLGCATPVPSSDNPCSGYLLVGESSTVLIDCGSGVFGHLANYCDPDDLAGIWISHLHPDHWGDLVAVANWALNKPGSRRIAVYGPDGWVSRLNNFFSPDGGKDVVGQLFDVHYIEDRRSEQLGEFTVDSRAVRHSVPAYGARITKDNTVLAYSGDSGPCATLKTIAHKSDLFLCEAGATTSSDYHLTIRQAYDLAIEATVRKLVLTHLTQNVNEQDWPTAGNPRYEIASPGAAWSI